MTFSPRAVTGPVVLVSAGTAAAVGARLALAAPLLAAALGLPLGPSLELEPSLEPEPTPWLEPHQDPDRALAALQEQRQAAGLWCLGLDPGLSLADGRPWAQALGAWRQPTLLLLEAAQLDTGVAAATTALLQQHGVPLLGLLQWGEPWRPELRRREGLPWLGALDPAGVVESGALRRALALQGAALG